MLLWVLSLFLILLFIFRYKEIFAITLLVVLLLITENIVVSILISLVVYVLLYYVEKNEDKEKQ